MTSFFYLFIFYFPLLLQFLPAEAIIAYDCSGTTVNKTTISLVQKPECTLEAKNITSENIVVAVTQTTLISEIKYIRCQVEAFHQVERCGTFIDTWQDGGFYSEIIKVSKEQCISMIKEKKYCPPGSATQIELSDGGYTKYSYTSFGSIEDGVCTSGGTLVSNTGVSWKHAIRNTRLEITYSTGDARLFHEENMVKFLEGYQCPLSWETCAHSGHGNTFWDVPLPGCNSKKNSESSLIYKGIAQYIKNTEDLEETYYVQVNQGNLDFQVKLLSKRVSICGFPSFATEHPRIFITILNVHSPEFPMIKPVGSEDVNLMNYMNSKFIYVLRNAKAQVEKLFELFNVERCKLENRITDNMMTLALLSPKEFAYQYFGGPGFTALVRGEVVHVAKCAEVAVIPNLNLKKCFNELPVIYKNTTYFMTPRTRILTQIGSEVECLPDLGSQFLINTQWITITPYGITTVNPPKIIQYESINYKFDVMENIASEGLYTEELITKYQKVLTSPIEEHIAVSQFASSLIGRTSVPVNIELKTPQGFLFGPFFWLKGWAETIGLWFSFFLFISMFIQVLSHIFSSYLNYQTILTSHGRQTALLTCCLGPIATHVRTGTFLKPEREPETIFLSEMS